MPNAAAIKPVLVQIAELRAGIDELKSDVKAVDLKSGILRTFEAGEAAALKGKLERAAACLEAARDAKDADEGGYQADRAARIINDVAVSLALEAAEFRAEMIRFRSRRRYEAELAQYEREAERAHGKFVAVASLLASVVAAIPKLG